MTAISNLPKDLHGKQITECKSELAIDIKFGLWKNYCEWLDPGQQTEYWYDSAVLSNAQVAVEIKLDNVVVACEQFDKFKTLHIHHSFNDDVGQCDLTVNVVNLSNLPIRDDTGTFVSGMIQIQSLKLQELDITHLLENTMFGNDCSVGLSMQKPTYKWLINQWPKIIPGVFNFPIAGIKTIN